MQETLDFDAAATRDVYTVSRLNDEARLLLEGTFSVLWIEGEISNLARPRSGHIYFTLKDSGAQVRCAMFRMRNRRLAFTPGDGEQVLARARVSLYRERGEFQLVVEHMEAAGAGALRHAFERLKQRLAEEGLFAAETKRPLPAFPRCIGVVTSPSGAALRDVLNVLARRFPAASVIVYPTRVQGEGAAEEIAGMLERADRRAECDVLLLVRGGGSLEDLWAFNEEPLARAIHRLRLPLVAGVGHETDFTIADFVADARAPTPSAAAELVSPDGQELASRVQTIGERLAGRMRRQLGDRRRGLAQTARRLRHPRVRLAQMAQRADELLLRLGNAAEAGVSRRHRKLLALGGRLAQVGPQERLSLHWARLRELRLRSRQAQRARLDGAAARLQGLARALHAMSPERTLERGYAVVSLAEGGAILRDSDQVMVGARVRARLARGVLLATVQEKESPGDGAGETPKTE